MINATEARKLSTMFYEKNETTKKIINTATVLIEDEATKGRRSISFEVEDNKPLIEYIKQYFQNKLYRVDDSPLRDNYRITISW